ncbi:hypothetical protein Franean1_0424 [Parafrankia sp. EAN1pec]|nr:hypothetical protein Franean1_0424 [Frankia sp. EAN1pec]
MRQFLRDDLRLELSAEKTLITHAQTGRARFLGYDIVAQHSDTKITRGRRAVNGAIGLRVPPEVIRNNRGFYSWAAWDTASATGAGLLWRAPTGLDLPVVRVLPDGTFLTALITPTIRGARRERLLGAARTGLDLDDINTVPDAFNERGLPVIHLARVIEYDVPDRVGNGTGELIVLLSTITDPAGARADELAAAYNERWEKETANDQLKTHLRGPGRVLRSRLPDLAYQEIWSYLIVHHAISALTAKASAAADLDPDSISFAKALRLIRRTATGTADIPPSGLD